MRTPDQRWYSFKLGRLAFRSKKPRHEEITEPAVSCFSTWNRVVGGFYWRDDNVVSK